MSRIDYDILSLFKGNPNVELSTSDIVSSLYPQDYTQAQDILQDSFSSKEAISQAKASVAKLHRRALHHASQLVKEGSLLISRIEGRGKKYYTLALQEGEELIIDKFKKKLIITKPSKPLLPLGDLDEKGITYLAQKNSFFERVNAVLLKSASFTSLRELYEYMYSLFSQVNDVIAVNDFELVLETFPEQEIISTLERIDDEAQSYNRRVCCIIDFSNIASTSTVISFFRTLFMHPLTHVVFVFDTTSRELLAQNDLVEVLIELYANANLKLNIKNDDVYSAPYFLGKNGPYTISMSDWSAYVKTHANEHTGIVCTQTTIAFDVAQARKLDASAKKMSEQLSQVAKALFYSNTYQRKYASDIHKKLLLNPSFNSIFSFSKNYIRFWNYEADDQELLLELLSSCKSECTDFAKMQETIYLSCGMPSRFKLGFAIAYRQFQDEAPLIRKFESLHISGIKDFYSMTFKERIAYFEKAAQVFSDGFEVRFTRTGVIEIIDVLSELSFILNSFKIPFFCYNFTEMVGANRKLDMFMK